MPRVLGVEVLNLDIFVDFTGKKIFEVLVIFTVLSIKLS